MTPLENIHYALGELAYSIARSDGKIQREEAAKFLKITSKELADKNYEFDVAQIIFDIMTKDRRDTQTTYNWAIRQIKLNSHYLSPKLKEKFTNVIEEVAKAFPPVTNEEKQVIENFKADIAHLNGDPVYYRETA